MKNQTNSAPGGCSELMDRVCFEIQNRILAAGELVYELKLPCFYDGHLNSLSKLVDGHDEKTGIVNAAGRGDDVISALSTCHKIQQDIDALIEVLYGFGNDVKDLALSYRNAIQVPYSSEAMYHAWAWQARIRGVKHWSVPNAPDSWEKDYTECVDLVRRITDGLDIHNLSFSFHADASKCSACFTVAEAPGDFEINFPLVGLKEVTDPEYLTGYGIGLTWRRHWVIPHYDYFFDDFRNTFDFDKVRERLLKFVNDTEWKEMYNMEGGKDRDGKWISYAEETKKYLQKALDKEFLRCGKDDEN